MPSGRVRTHVSENLALPGNLLRENAPRNGVSLLFPAGLRPSADRIADLLETAESGGVAARVSFRPPPDEGWLELLSSGLTFDLLGLSPAGAAAAVEAPHSYGFDDIQAPCALEAVDLVPGGHIAGGAGLLPVVRTQVGIAAALALELPVAAVAWQSAGTLMEPRYFARVVMNWLAGGAFPALGLTALAAGSDGSIATKGLSRFIGQEMQLEARDGEPPADAIKLAIRVVDYLVRNGRLTEPREIEAPGGNLLAEPSQVGRQIWVWRGG
ncbi:hypothetical protein EDF59_104277 [Novosphingobium sp. ST904]|nr:hypothetical protein EDF59_104277 [Novosphingobium sp. ST904]